MTTTTQLLTDDTILTLSEQIIAEREQQEALEFFQRFYGPLVTYVRVRAGEYYNDEYDEMQVTRILVLDAEGKELAPDRTAPGWIALKNDPSGSSYIQYVLSEPLTELTSQQLLYVLRHHLAEIELISGDTDYNFTQKPGRSFTNVSATPEICPDPDPSWKKVFEPYQTNEEGPDEDYIDDDEVEVDDTFVFIPDPDGMELIDLPSLYEAATYAGDRYDDEG